MNEKEKSEVKKLILVEIEKTEKSVANYKELTKPIAPENAIGRVSRMDAINNKSVIEAALRTAMQKLEGLNVALNNVDNEDFGICGRCKKPIQLGRILLMPHKPFCVACSR